MTLFSNGLNELTKDCYLEAGTTVEFKVVGNHDWGYSWPWDGNCSLYIDATGYYNLKFTFDPNTCDCSVQIL